MTDVKLSLYGGCFSALEFSGILADFQASVWIWVFRKCTSVAWQLSTALRLGRIIFPWVQCIAFFKAIV